jgi:hypothetical protein
MPVTDPGYEARLKYIQNRMLALPGTYNPQREALAATSARGVTDSLYADQADWSALTPDSAGNVNYTLNLRGEGQAQRNMLQGNAGSFNARGGYFSTARARADRQGTQQVTNARDAMLRRFQMDQTGIVDQQEQARVGLSGEEATTQGDYASWRLDQPAAAPAPEVPAPGEAASAPSRRVWTGNSDPVKLRAAGWNVSRRGPSAKTRWVAIKG